MIQDTFAVKASFAQERLWFLQVFDPDSPAYNIPTALVLPAELTRGRVFAALARIIERHEALRTTFELRGDQPMQVIAAHREPDLTSADLRALPAAEREAAHRAIARDQVDAPFDLERGPLLRAKLVRLGDDDQYLLLTLHHIIADAWSIGILLRELSQLLATPGAELPPLDFQYADYAQWQRDRLSGEYFDRLLAFWRGELTGAPGALELPWDFPRPPTQSHRGALHSFALSENLTQSVRALARREGATTFMVLLSAFAVLLQRYSNQTDLLVGTPVVNRGRSELEGVIGYLSNTLVLRLNVSGEPTFRELLRRVKDSTLRAYEHQDMPFERLVAALDPARAPHATPFFQVLFSLQNTPTLVASAGPELERVNEQYSASKFDLSLLLGEGESQLVGAFEYCTDLFHRSTIEAMQRCFVRLLESAVSEAARSVARLSLSNASERAELIRRSTSDVAPEAQRLVQQWVGVQACARPDATALCSAAGAKTYAELEAESARIVHLLRSVGVGPGTRVGLRMERSVQGVVALVGILRAGAVYVPLDAQHPLPRQRYILGDAGVRFVLVDAQGRRDLEAVLEGASGLQLLAADDALRRGDQVERAADADVDPDALAYIVYTSGSTGQPKGVAVTHTVLANLAVANLRESPLRTPRTAQFAAWGFDVSLQEMFCVFREGGTLVLASDAARQDPRLLFEELARWRVERLYLPPVALRQLAEVAAARLEVLNDLREVVAAGEQLRVTPAIRSWFERTPRCRLVNQYGPSETHIVTEYWLNEQPSTWPALPSIGKGLRGTAIHVLDHALEPVPDGMSGEIYVAGQVAAGYIGQPELERARFLPDPFSGNGRMYRTGDRARRDSDGNLEFLGRLDRQVKIRGFRVEPEEVDAELVKHPGVVAAATVDVDDELSGKRLVCYFVPAPQRSPSSVELRTHLGQWLPEYMIPSEFVLLDALPVNANGKLDRVRLPAPQRVLPQASPAYEPARTEAEARLLEIWHELLGVPAIGIHDNFFALGGHSLLAMRLMAQLREQLGVDLAVRQIFENPTVARLAPLLRRDVESAASALESLVDEIELLSEQQVEALLQSSE